MASHYSNNRRAFRRVAWARQAHHRKLLWIRLHLAEVSESLQTVLEPLAQLAERHVAAGVILVYRLRRADTPLAAASWIETRSTDVQMGVWVYEVDGLDWWMSRWMAGWTDGRMDGSRTTLVSLDDVALRVAERAHQR